MANTPKLKTDLLCLLRLEWGMSPFKRSVDESRVSSHQKSPHVRIPSQFNDSNFYASRKDRTEAGGRSGRLSKSSWVGNQRRQVIRMILALVLVMVVMNAAAQPEFYQPFFDSPTSDPASSKLAASNTSEAKVEIPQEARQQVAQHVTSLSADKQVSLARSLIRTLDRLQNNELDSSLQETLGLIPINSAAVPPKRLARLLISCLIAEAEKRVVDGAVWRSGDRDALRLRLLMTQQTATNVDLRPAAIVGALPLLQQPEVFRGQRVRIQGKVARVEMIREGATKDDPLPDYWQLWIRPSSGADRPVVALVASVPENLMRFKEGEPDNGAPRVVVDGTFFKRLAYQSSVGADLAPVVVGRLWQPEFAAFAPQGEPAAINQVGGVRPFFVIAGAICAGAILACLVVWRTAVSAKRTRLTRRQRDADVLVVPPGMEDSLVKPNHE